MKLSDRIARAILQFIEPELIPESVAEQLQKLRSEVNRYQNTAKTWEIRYQKLMEATKLDELLEQCQKKRHFSNREAAEYAAAVVYLRDNLLLKEIPCRFCGQWVLTGKGVKSLPRVIQESLEYKKGRSQTMVKLGDTHPSLAILKQELEESEEAIV